MGWEDLDVTTISAFLDHLEEERHNGARSRNSRLAAIRSLFRFAALRHPEHARQIAQVLAVPQKRSDKRQVSFLEPEEVEALARALGQGHHREPGRQRDGELVVHVGRPFRRAHAHHCPLRTRVPAAAALACRLTKPVRF